MILIDETIWLLHVYFFFEGTIQERSLNVHSMDLHIELLGNGKCCTNPVVLCHRCKYFIVVDTGVFENILVRLVLLYHVCV